MNIPCFENIPGIVLENKNFLVARKPHGIPTVPVTGSEKYSLLDFVSKSYPEVLEASPDTRKKDEGGVIHRLDNGTYGLVLIARNKKTAGFFINEQKSGRICKEYIAVTKKNGVNDIPEGFPTPAFYFLDKKDCPCSIQSRFRYYGKGRQAVRPVRLDEENRLIIKKTEKNIYTTDILSVDECCQKYLFRLRLVKGFRHQIRSHLAWCSYPIIGDELYGGEKSPFLELYAVTLNFRDPETERNIRCQLG